MDPHSRDAHTQAIIEFVRLGFGPAHALSFEVGIGRDPTAFTAAINAIGDYNAFTPVVVIAAFRPLWIAWATSGSAASTDHHSSRPCCR